jgi:hypothetical protein
MSAPVVTTYTRVAELPLTIEDYVLEGRDRVVAPQFTRRTTIFHLRGAGEEGLGEDVTYDPEEHGEQQERGPVLPLAGEWTFHDFAQHVGTLDLFPAGDPQQSAYRLYRRWGIESAALDLALRQAGRSLADVLEREPQPVEFVVSMRLGDPPSFKPVADRLEVYPWLRFKLDGTPDWPDELIERLVETGAIASIDFKGAYKGTAVDVDTDPGFYRRIAEAFPDAWLEDPDLTVPEAGAALEPHRDRITWDAPIHSVADIEALAFPPKTVNVKPSRFGSVQGLFAGYDYCDAHGIEMYGGGQIELGVGRGQIQALASLFHPAGVNDIAPSGYDWAEFLHGLEPSPLAPNLESTGMRRRT